MVLRWLTQRGIVAIPKLVQPAQMATNLDASAAVLHFAASWARLDVGTRRSLPHAWAPWWPPTLW